MSKFDQETTESLVACAHIAVSIYFFSLGIRCIMQDRAVNGGIVFG